MLEHAGSQCFSAAGVLLRCGQPQLAEELLAQQTAGATSLLLYHFFRGDFESALDAYASAIEQRDPLSAFYSAAVFLKPLRENPRWPALARLMNLPERP